MRGGFCIGENSVLLEPTEFSPLAAKNLNVPPSVKAVLFKKRRRDVVGIKSQSYGYFNSRPSHRRKVVRDACRVPLFFPQNSVF